MSYHDDEKVIHGLIQPVGAPPPPPVGPQLHSNAAAHPYTSFGTTELSIGDVPFWFCVDANDNELAYLEAIHLFIRVLGAVFSTAPLASYPHSKSDTSFDDVCEINLVINFYTVRQYPLHP